MRRSAGDRASLGHIRAVKVLKHHETDLAFIIWARLAAPNAIGARQLREGECKVADAARHGTYSALLLRMRRMDSVNRRYAGEKKRRPPKGTARVVIS